MNPSESAQSANADKDPIADAATPRRQRPLTDLFPIVVGVLVVVALSLAWLQVLHPYIEHDDWDSLLPVTPTRQHYIHGRLLNEGRWLNYWWWLGLGHLYTTVGASLLYQFAYLAFVARVAWRWAPGWLSLPVVIALFASPMVVQTSFWPATLALSMVIAALAAWTLPLCVARNRTLVPWIVASVVLSFLTYPPVTLVLFLVLAVELIDDSWKRLIRAAILFGASYLVTIDGVDALNEQAFGKFGIEPQAWRNPHYLHNLHDLWINIQRYLTQINQLAHVTAVPVVIGLCALAACLAVSDLRHRAVRLVLGFVVVMGLEAGPTILDGVVTPYRGSPWAWFLPVVPLVWLVREQAYPWLRDRSVPWPRVFRTVAVLALVTVSIWGIQYWRNAIHDNQHRLALYNSVEQQLDHAAHQYPSSQVFIYGDASDWAQGVFTQEVQYLSDRAYYSYGITTSNCRPSTCSVPDQPGVAAQIQRGVQVIHSAGAILVVPPSHA